MLQSIRDGSRSWGAKIIIGVMVAAMALFGVESLFSVFGSDPNEVASVNGEPIMRQQVELEVQRALRSGQVPPEQERALRNDMLDQLITQSLLRQYAEDGGFYVSDAQLDQMIVTLPEFHDQDGRFSAEIFRNRLAGAGYTPLSFREELRMDIKRQQLQQGLAFSDFSLANEEQRLADLQGQQRDFRYVMLDANDAAYEVEVTEEQMQAYYDANQERFERPEQVRVEYVVIDRQAMAEDIAVDESELRAAWREQNRDANRRVSHIMVTFGSERGREEAQQLANEALADLSRGESFADTAVRFSDDTASAEQGGDLGVISRGFFGDAFDDAAFALGVGETSQVVEMDGAFHILQVTELDAPSFEEQRDRLAQEVALREVNDDFNRQVQRLIDESFAADDLQSVADDLGLTLNESDWLARGEGEGALSEPGVLDEAFSADVLEEGYNSEVIELDNDRRLVLRVAEHRDATVLPLDEVRDEVEQAVAAQQRQEALQEQAAELIALLRAGDAVELEWLEANNVSRQSDSTLPQVLIREVFRMPHPEEGDSVYRAVTLPQGVAVVALDSVNEGQADEQMNAFVSQMAEQLRAQAIIQGLIDDLRSDARIER
ncbi:MULTISPECIES: SurA N-terminal domain-containing protein [Halomonadaceae]|jgi:peptidyl-prolyl cis-trans isomerase D|uniref:Periplasmic chaperone PpiD n=1 Tax=Vreelandella aquamarina TaxID=77097 RepID=A0A1N6CNK7_9GAMM|nr:MULTISPECIES: SurA N-terminal domain-containing protein [Halomonas]MBV66017.1 peptidylprolyl isomerase [Halomonas sp.]MCP1303820.1 SurA N-terminal domain-containing protein [Halomonas sp. R1t8]MCP1329865.1 SurA N-terminal domain-containing protein [Halomonas sp. R1t4]PHR02706.1 MAG: peptidylprolyl isomerase [Halomonas sp.]SEN57809.1 peptidyl-prolyl cis-trans isomerase D [Halomonas aquamarina]|tara:strand:+ start:1130 stop:2947 length:1818 start_codon:yes stop_codon:yes gene_type:complete